MKKMNKKGFTIVELVIVIAVIAILAAVLMPTFDGVISKAQESAAQQKLANAYKEAYALAISDGYITDADVDIEVGGFKFAFINAETVTVECPEGFGYTADFAAGKWTLTEAPATPAPECNCDEQCAAPKAECPVCKDSIAACEGGAAG